MCVCFISFLQLPLVSQCCHQTVQALFTYRTFCRLISEISLFRESLLCYERGGSPKKFNLPALCILSSPHLPCSQTGRHKSSEFMSKPAAHCSCVRARDEQRPARVAVMCLRDQRGRDGELNPVEQWSQWQRLSPAKPTGSLSAGEAAMESK